MPGVPEAGDGFGSAIALGSGIICQEDAGVEVGAPGQDVDGVADAGAVIAMQIDGSEGCPARELSRGHGLRGAPVAGDRVGETLGLTPDRPGLDEDTHDTLLVGAPGSGVVLTSNAGYDPHQGILRPPPGTDGFGEAFAIPF